MRRCTELLIFLGLFLFIIQQYVTPTVEVSEYLTFICIYICVCVCKYLYIL